MDNKDFMDELEIDEDKRDDVENDVYCAFDLELCQNISYYISLLYERSYIDDKIKELLSECVELKINNMKEVEKVYEFNDELKEIFKKYERMRVSERIKNGIKRKKNMN